jgi:quercetin dioxygenase-like cupin family protein
MLVVDLVDLATHPVEPVLAFEPQRAVSSEFAAGHGEAHVHVVRMQADGVVGPHEAGLDQLFVVVSGTGWLTCEGNRVELRAGQAGFVARGQVHSKGAITELVALAIQVTNLRPTE